MLFSSSASGLTARQQAYQVLNLMLVVSTALMLWKGLGILFNTESPIVVVLSESMEPEFHRGDLLFLAMTSDRIESLQIPVFKLKGRDIPIVHRTLRAHDEVKNTQRQFILTKGDNNPVDDRGLYNRGQDWINRNDVMGRVYGYLPNVGMLTIIMNDYPIVKYALLACLGIVTLMTREQ